jgi:hypothetical protein
VTVARRLPPVNIYGNALFLAPVRALMKCRSRWFEFDLPVECWVAAGMQSFIPFRLHYRAANSEHVILSIDNIEVRPRGPLFEEGRMIRVLELIRLNHAMEPIHVFDKASGDGRTRVLNHGYHRLLASIAVGFTQVPAVLVRDLDEIKRAEGMA